MEPESSLSREQQMNVLNEAWDLVSKANSLLGRAGLHPVVYETQKEVLKALNEINRTRTLIKNLELMIQPFQVCNPLPNPPRSRR